jgi:hypothetical protein
MYLIEDTHEGIIPKDTFAAVQAKIARRAAIGGKIEHAGVAFHGKIQCVDCGKRYMRCVHHGDKYYWICWAHKTKKGHKCNTKLIPEITLMEIVADVLGLEEYDGEVFTQKVERIIAQQGRQLTFVFHDSAEKTIIWEGWKDGKNKGNPGN